MWKHVHTDDRPCMNVSVGDILTLSPAYRDIIIGTLQRKVSNITLRREVLCSYPGLTRVFWSDGLGWSSPSFTICEGCPFYVEL